MTNQFVGVILPSLCQELWKTISGKSSFVIWGLLRKTSNHTEPQEALKNNVWATRDHQSLFCRVPQEAINSCGFSKQPHHTLPHLTEPHLTAAVRALIDQSKTNWEFMHEVIITMRYHAKSLNLPVDFQKGTLLTLRSCNQQGSSSNLSVSSAIDIIVGAGMDLAYGECNDMTGWAAFYEGAHPLQNLSTA